jgi:hypothetical protein
MVINKKHSELIFTDNTVIKTTSPELMSIEYEKHKRAYEIGKESGLFRVPKIYEIDLNKGVMTLEYINNLTRFSSLLFQTSDLTERVGRSLAVIHKSLSLSDEMISAIPDEIASTDEVFLHGDFNGENVCIDKSDNSIVILDWQMTSVYGGKATYGSRLFDLIWFITYSFWEPKIKDIYSNRAIQMANLFIDSYIDESNSSFEKKDIYRYAQDFFELELVKVAKNKSIKKNILLKYSLHLNKKFIKSMNGIY